MQASPLGRKARSVVHLAQGHSFSLRYPPRLRKDPRHCYSLLQVSRRNKWPVQAAHESTSSLESHDEETLQEILEHMPSSELSKETVASQTEIVASSTRSVALYVGGAFLFGLGIWATIGIQPAEEFFAGYLLEQSLSVDNLFVFILIFNYFKTPVDAQGKVLTYGLVTAAVLRLTMILLGVELVENFKPVLLAFAAVLLYSAYGLIVKKEEDDGNDLSKNKLVAFCQDTLNVAPHYDGDKFFTELDGVKRGTPLLLALAVIELSDVLFAVDSIPAVFGVTTDPFVIWTSNMWALLSLRSLFGFVAVAISQLRFLDKAIAVVLAWVSLKLAAEYAGYEISTPVSLGVVASSLAAGIAASLAFPAEQSD